MAKQAKPVISLRKAPTQARAQGTVDTILEASAQILQKEGEAALTTNRIAAHAGFSIGTLYQYFPNREAILAAMATREQAHILAKLEAVLARLDPAAPEPTVREAIAALLGAFRGRHGVRRAVILGVMRRMPDDPRASAGVAEPLLAALEARCAGHFAPLGDAGRFVLLRAISGAVRAAPSSSARRASSSGATSSPCPAAASARESLPPQQKLMPFWRKISAAPGRLEAMSPTLDWEESSVMGQVLELGPRRGPGGLRCAGGRPRGRRSGR